MAEIAQKIVPCLWFNMDCDEAMQFYVDTFNSAPHSDHNARIVHIQRYPEQVQYGPVEGMGGKVLMGLFDLAGQRFMAFDGGPQFKFTEAISLCMDCEDQAEIDHFWNALSAVPDAEACGWLKDKYGVSWQIVPKQLGELMEHSDPEKSARVMQALLEMKKLIIADLENA